MFNHQSQLEQLESSIASSNLPALSAERYAQLVGSPIGVVEAQLNRHQLPSIKIGSRRFVNIEALRQTAKQDPLSPVSQPSSISVSGQIDPPGMSPTEKSLMLSIDNTAQCLGLAPKTIRKWLSNGTCPFPTVLIGARRLIRRTDLEKFVNELGQPSIAPASAFESALVQPIKRGRGRPRNSAAPSSTSWVGGVK